MNQNEKYLKYALCREMLETPEVIKNFRVPGLDSFVREASRSGDVLLTGEGSSRIFPAKRAITQSLMKGEKTRFLPKGQPRLWNTNSKTELSSDLPIQERPKN